MVKMGKTMKVKQKIIVSDFDGTLTTSDSMLRIIICRRGLAGLILAMVRILPWLLLMAVRLYSNQRTKERLLHICFGDMDAERFRTFCRSFAKANRGILRDSLMREIMEEKAKGTEVVVVTASPAIWVREFMPDGVTVLGSELDFTGGMMSKRFKGRNCYGMEKVERLCAFMPQLRTDREAFYVTAYGDSRGDREMLSFADDPHWINSKAQ